MSEKELYRLQILKEVEEKKMSVAKAAKMLKISLRQLSRIRRSFKRKGAKGLISKKVGALGNHRIPEEQEKLVLHFFKKEEYMDFCPTLAREYMIKSLGLKISLSSVRNIMIRHGLWVANVKRKKNIHPLRQRRSQFGELEQIDGSEHDWFESRGSRCSLLVIVDDATSSIPHAKFVKSENLNDYFYFVREYIELSGIPKAFYSDKHSVFRVNRKTEEGGKTQFARAMDELGILLIFANSPQAKGRVERRNKDLQDRLVKALRIAQISSIEAANVFLPIFLEEFNLQFAKAPESSVNAHQPTPSSEVLDRIFCIKIIRVLSKNLTLQHRGILYQIYSDDQLSLRGVKVDVIESLTGIVKIERKGKALRAVPYGEVETPLPEVCSKELMDALVPKPRKKYIPPKNHPWKSKHFP